MLDAAGYRVSVLQPAADDDEPTRSLCCGRTYLSIGQVEAARTEARRPQTALRPALAAGTPIIGLEPSCILSLRDDHLKLGLGEEALGLAKQVYLFEEFIDREHDRKRLRLNLNSLSDYDAFPERPDDSPQCLNHYARSHASMSPGTTRNNG